MGSVMVCPRWGNYTSMLRRGGSGWSANRPCLRVIRQAQLSARKGRPAPTIIINQNNNPMRMIRHDDECPQFHVPIMIFQVKPCIADDVSIAVQPHFPIHHIAEQAFPLPCNNGHKICACLRIIISLQADGTAMMPVPRMGILWIKFHVLADDTNFIYLRHRSSGACTVRGQRHGLCHEVVSASHKGMICAWQRLVLSLSKGKTLSGVWAPH